MPERENVDFRGSLAYASLHAHLGQVGKICDSFCKDLSRRDDLWSLFFVTLEFLDF